MFLRKIVRNSCRENSKITRKKERQTGNKKRKKDIQAKMAVGKEFENLYFQNHLNTDFIFLFKPFSFLIRVYFSFLFTFYSLAFLFFG